MQSHDENSVAARWEKVVASEGSRYRSVVVDGRKIAHLVDSAYIRAVTERVGEGAKCLETGCGSGSLSLALASTGRSVTTLDISPAVLQNLVANRDRLAQSNPRIADITPVRGDIEHMPFADGAFDAVFSEGVIEHWTTRDARLLVMREMARVTRPGGWLVLFVPNGRHPLHGWWQRTGYPGYKSENEVPWHRFSAAELASELAQIGLTEITHDGISPWSTLAIWPNWFILRALAALCRRVFPEPLSFRRKFGFNLMASGRKPGRAAP
jgi:SAM-dependent methyltransferase